MKIQETWENGMKQVLLDPGEYVCREVECPNCNGAGQYMSEIPMSPGRFFQCSCERCNGTGVVPERVKAE